MNTTPDADPTARDVPDLGSAQGLSRPDVEGILARADAAAEGPWTLDRRVLGPLWIDVPGDRHHIAMHGMPEDATFIAAARTDVPALARYVLALEAQVADSRAETERMVMVVSDAESEARFQHERAERAEARVRAVSALADEPWSSAEFEAETLVVPVDEIRRAIPMAEDQPAEPTTGREEGEQ